MIILILKVVTEMEEVWTISHINSTHGNGILKKSILILVKEMKSIITGRHTISTLKTICLL